MRNFGSAFGFLVLSLLIYSNSEAVERAGHVQEVGHPFSLGIVVGAPSGITWKYALNSRNAVDGGLAFSWDHYFLLYSDYLWVVPGLAGPLIPYLGVGGVLFVATNEVTYSSRYFPSSRSSAGLGFRIPLGLEWRMPEPRFAFFLELAPGIGLLPESFGFLQGGLGARYSF